MKLLKTLVLSAALLLAGCVSTIPPIVSPPQESSLDKEYRENPHSMRIIFYTFGSSEDEVRRKAKQMQDDVGEGVVVESKVITYPDGVVAGRFVIQFNMANRQAPVQSNPESARPKLHF